MLGHYAISEYAISEFPMAFVPPPEVLIVTDGYKRGERKKHQTLEDKLVKLRELKTKARQAKREGIIALVAPELLPKKEAVTRETIHLPEPEYFDEEIAKAQAELDGLKQLRYLRLERERLERIEAAMRAEQEDEETLLLLLS